MRRYLAALPLSLAVLLAAAGALAEVRLRANVEVVGEEVTLGDVLEGAGAAAAVHVAPAPPPGRRLVLRGADLEALASSHGLEWPAATPVTSIEVVRASHRVPKATIQEALERALAAAGVEGSFRVELRNHGLPLMVPRNIAPTLEVASLDLDDRNGRFHAVLAAPADGPAATRVQVSGRVIEITEIPVLRRPMAVGAIIGEDDIAWLPVPTDKVNRNVVTDVDALLGKSPKRVIAHQRPVRAQDVRRPIMVEKGTLVTMRLVAPAMVITATGHAVESGSEGDVIRVRNTRSHMVVQGVIVDATLVKVLAKPRLVTATE